MQIVPLLKERSLDRAGFIGRSRQQPFVRRQHPKDSPRPVRKQQQRSGDKCRFAGDVPGLCPQQEADERQASLHCKSSLVGKLPLGKQRSIVQSKAGRLFGEVDVERRSCKDTRHHQGDTSCDQGSSPSVWENSDPLSLPISAPYASACGPRSAKSTGRYPAS